MSIEIKISEFTDEQPVDLRNNTYGTAYYGLWRKKIDVMGTERTYCVYTPKAYFPTERILYIYLPEHITTEAFAEKSVWNKLGEENNVAIAYLEPLSGMWGTDESEEAYMSAVLMSFYDIEHALIEPSWCSRYLIGYKEGAAIALSFALKHTIEIAGLVMVNARNVDDQLELHSRANSGLLPTWVIDETTRNDGLLDFLCKINDVSDEGLYNEYGRVFLQKQRVFSENRNKRALSKVWSSVLLNSGESYTDECLCNAIWNKFLSKVIRFANLPGGQLVQSFEPSDYGMKLYQEQMEHAGFDVPVWRRWLTYAPSSYDGKIPVPLVIATHGFTGTAEAFAAETEFYKVAEERGFVVVFTQAAPCQNVKTGLARWRSGAESLVKLFGEYDNLENQTSELRYFRKVVETVCEDYNIDRTRIYCTGHSNGSQMTYVVAEKMKDIFAASAQVGFSERQYAAIEDMPESDRRLPYLNIEMEFDRENDPDDAESMLYWDIRYRLKENGLEPQTAEYTEADNGLYKTRSYQNSEGIPVVNYIYHRHAQHSYFPEISYIVWDQFFCNFSRDADGTSRYRKKKIL